MAPVYALSLMTVTSYVLLQITPPGSPPNNWLSHAEAGSLPVRHPKTEQLQPPRSRYVRRYGAVVLGLDHFCSWLGVPTGLRNRKHYLQFTFYSVALVACALALDLVDVSRTARCVYDLKPRPAASLCATRELHSSALCERRRRRDEMLLEAATAAAADVGRWWFGGRGGRGIGGRGIGGRGIGGRGGGRSGTQPSHVNRAERTLALRMTLCFERTDHATGSTHAALTPYLCLLNLMVTAAYGRWACCLFHHAARNRTVLCPHDDRYDVGTLANLRQIFGAGPVLLWPLPMPWGATRFTGLSYPLNPHSQAADASAGSTAPGEELVETTSHSQSGVENTALEEAAINEAPPREACRRPYAQPFRRANRPASLQAP